MKKIIALLTTVIITLNTQATLLTVEMNQNSYQIGDVLTADIIISDIEEDYLGFQKLLASFELEISWDNPMLDYTVTTFGVKLDVDPDPFYASDQSINEMASSLSLSEISYAFSDDLYWAQDGLDSFVLASVNFNVIGSGSDHLAFTNVALGDDFGDSFSQLTSIDKSYSVAVDNPVNVPEPSAMVLMLMALILLVRQRKIS